MFDSSSPEYILCFENPKQSSYADVHSKKLVLTRIKYYFLLFLPLRINKNCHQDWGYRAYILVWSLIAAADLSPLQSADRGLRVLQFELT